jgi:site-specific DNA-methyltransferase (adenine-specific)
VKLVNDDCMNCMKLMENDSVDMVLTDIPYGEVNRKHGSLRILDKGKADELTFELEPFVNELVRICKGSFYIFCGTEQVSILRKMFVDKGLTTRLGIWEKSNPSPMNGEKLWLSGIECCVFARKAKATFNEHCKNTVWRFPNGRSKQHPTEKPIKLFEYLVKASSNQNDILFDPCMGSGTTGVACKNLGRNFIGVELDKEYFEIAKTRINQELNLE